MDASKIFPDHTQRETLDSSENRARRGKKDESLDGHSLQEKSAHNEKEQEHTKAGG